MFSLADFIVDKYKSQSQKIRVASEDWFVLNGYCIDCFSDLSKFPNNQPVADFFCKNCIEQYELKSKNGKVTK